MRDCIYCGLVRICLQCRHIDVDDFNLRIGVKSDMSNADHSSDPFLRPAILLPLGQHND